jgi:hypothetical protein
MGAARQHSPPGFPVTSAFRREQIRLLTNALMHVKGYAAPETKASLHQARLCIERERKHSEGLSKIRWRFSRLYTAFG